MPVGRLVMTDAEMLQMVADIFAAFIGGWAVFYGVIAILDFFKEVAGAGR